MNIKTASKKTKILPVHIYSLIRFKIISCCFVNGETSVNIAELQKWIEKNKDVYIKLRKKQSSTYTENQMYSYLVKIGKIAKK